jgi:hypothetical protein
VSGFERQYVLVSLRWDIGGSMTDRINAAVAEHDNERAAASVACMTTSERGMHILIEKWRDSGDSEQDTTGAVDEAAAARKPRRARTQRTDDAGAA